MRQGARLGSRLWWGLPLLVVLLWAVGVLTLVTLPGLPVPPLVTQVGLPLARFARDIAAIVTVGALVVGGLLTGSRQTPVMRWAAGWAGAWLVSLAVLLVLTVSDIRAVTPADAADPASLVRFLLDEAIGHVFAVQGAAVVLVLVLILGGAQPVLRWLAAGVAVAASAAPAFLGHADAVHSHVAATLSLAFHIAAISVWVGGLAALVGLILINQDAGAAAISRFSLVALVCVLVVAESGLLNASLRVGEPSAFVSTPYGALVIAKAVLLGSLVWAGWIQRRRVVPLVDAEPSATILLRVAGWEFVAMGAAIAVSVTLSRLGPGPVAGSGGEFLPFAAVLLSMAVGILLALSMAPRPDRPWIRRVRGLPEVAAVVVLVVAVEVLGVGVLDVIVGRQVGAVLASLLLIGAGWVWAVAADDRRAVPSVVVLMAGWPLIVWASHLLNGTGSLTRLDLIAIALAEVLLVAMLRRVRNRVGTVPVDALESVGG